VSLTAIRPSPSEGVVVVQPSQLVGPPNLFTPADLSSLYAWYDASDLGLANNDPVTSWTDKSGGGRHLTGTAPTFKTNVQNGLSGVLFDGTDDAHHDD
jgi:hypothetical protein